MGPAAGIANMSLLVGPLVIVIKVVVAFCKEWTVVKKIPLASPPRPDALLSPPFDLDILEAGITQALTRRVRPGCGLAAAAASDNWTPRSP